jgi:HAE1 family hydrophobic/amphiphilic exporter-1
MLEGIFRKATGVVLLTVLLCATGVFLVTELPIQLYPQTQRPRVRAIINHTGVSALDFSSEYADQIESRLLAVEGVDILEVGYENDRSRFTMTFDWNTDPEEARADVDTAMNGISNLLPADYRDNYRVGFFSGENAGFLIMGITSASASPEELYRILDTTIRPTMSTVEDAESVEIYRVEDLDVELNLRQTDMLAYGLDIRDVESALQVGSRPESVGRLERGGGSYNVRFRRGSDSLFDIGRIVVTQKGNVSIRLQDIADISLQYALPSRTFVMNGTRGIRITAAPIDGGNVRKMSEDVQAIMEEAKAEGILPEDTLFQMYLDPAEYINRSIRNVIRAALLGAALAMIVVLFGLGQLRNTLLIGISLPVTLVLSFILMYFFKVSLNLISLGGIALAVGMVIDSSIVVIENIHRFRMEEAPIRDNGHLRTLVIRAVKQVRAPVIASTLTSVLVFLPISFTAPLTNAILGDQARTVVFALLISMVVALTLIPLVAFRFYSFGAKGQRNDTGGMEGEGTGEAHALRGLQRLTVPMVDLFKNLYKTVLAALLRRRWASLLFMVFSFGLLVFSILKVLPLIPREIIAAPLSDRIVLFFRSSELTDRTKIIEEVIPDMDVRIKEIVGENLASTYADVSGRFNLYFVNLISTSVANEVLADLQKEFVSDNTWYYNVMMWDPAQLPLPRTMDLQISVHGDDPAEAVAVLERIRDLVNETEVYGWAFTNPSTNFSDELTMTAREEVLAGTPEFNERSLLTLVRKILGGTTAVEFKENGQTVPVSAIYPEAEIQGRQKMENFLLPFRQRTVPLKHFFDFQESTGVAGIASENGERIFRLYARMSPGTAAARRAEYEQQVRELLAEKLELPSGYSITFDNPQEEMDKAIRSLFVALGAAVLLIYLLLAFQFNSLHIPLVILVTVPLGFIGVVFSLYLFKSTLSLNSMLGTILLGGIVVNNAIIMIDFYLKILPRYQDRIEALVETAGLRFTPIVMTMLTTVFGMLPIAIGLGEGSNIVQPLGIAVSGGLVISTLFTLFMVPSILSLMRVKPANSGREKAL